MGGLIRDLHGLRQVGLPVHARGPSPRRPAKSGPGTVGLPVDVGGVSIGPGDVIVGDDNGVVVVPLEKIAEAGETLASLLRRDAENARRVKAGATEPAGLSTLLEQVGVRWFP
jgi:4-hydroxy-4-methyl-2-oxoglutarate aldolase